MKWLKPLIYFLLCAYLLACTLLYFNQEQLIFHPRQLPDNYAFRAGQEVFIPVDDDVDLHALWLKEPRSKGVILFWHGNVGSNRRCLRQADQLTGLGYDIFMPDYRGYGKSDDEMRNEYQMYDDAQAVYDWLKQHYREDQIVVLGYSLGTGVSTFLAQENNPERLVLVAPYQSMVAMKNLILPVAPSLLLKYPLRNDEQLPNASCPVLIFHGTGDELIPPQHSEYLQSLVPDRSELYLLPGVSHRGAIFSSTLRAELTRALRG